MQHQELAKREITPQTPKGGRRPIDESVVPQYHLFMDYKIFMCQVGEVTELYFSLYNRTENRFVTDEYQVVLTSMGMPTDIDKRWCTIFPVCLFILFFFFFFFLLFIFTFFFSFSFFSFFFFYYYYSPRPLLI